MVSLYLLLCEYSYIALQIFYVFDFEIFGLNSYLIDGNIDTQKIK
jgi:hypothetical protein